MRAGTTPDEVNVVVKSSAKTPGWHLIQPQNRLVWICNPAHSHTHKDQSSSLTLGNTLTRAVRRAHACWLESDLLHFTAMSNMSLHCSCLVFPLTRTFELLQVRCMACITSMVAKPIATPNTFKILFRITMTCIHLFYDRHVFHF